MTLTNLILPLVFFFILFLSLKIIRTLFYFVYLAQLKEYRWDRIRAHFTTISGVRQLLDYFNLFKWHNFYRPRFTLRIFLVLVLTFFVQYNFFFFILRYFFRTFKSYPNLIVGLLIIAFYLVNIITPLAVGTATFLTFLAALPIKKLIIKLATAKINRHQNLLVIGITGSYGKTAVKEIMAVLLEEFFQVIKTPLNCNTQVGIALYILRKLRSSQEIFVVEMGGYKKGEIARICQMVQPKVGIITGINEQHQALFGSLKDIQWAKFELIKSLPKDGLAIFNANNQYTARLYKATGIPKELYGRRMIKMKLSKNLSFHQENIQPAFLVAYYLGLTKDKFSISLRRLTNLSLLPKIISGKSGAKIIDDSYSSNPTGFCSALNLLKRITGRSKILLTPGIIELGKASDEVHKTIGAKAAQVCTKVFLTKPDFYKSLKKGVKRRAKGFIQVEEDEIELKEKLLPYLKKGTVLLLEGRLPYSVKKFALYHG